MYNLEWIAQVGGIAGVFAVVLFWIYRHDRKASEDRLRDDRRFMEDRMMKVLDDYNIASSNHNEMLNQFRETLLELTIYLKAKNGSR